MIDDHHGVRACCETCHQFREMDVPVLVALAEKVGRDYSLVNRRCRCKLKVNCPGWTTFHWCSGVYRPLRTPERGSIWIARDWERKKQR